MNVAEGFALFDFSISLLQGTNKTTGRGGFFFLGPHNKFYVFPHPSPTRPPPPLIIRVKERNPRTPTVPLRLRNGNEGLNDDRFTELLILPCRWAPVLPSLCVVEESGGDVEGVGSGGAAMILKIAMLALLASGGDDCSKRVEDARVSFLAPSRFGFE
ncbi:hypothetical protein ACLB2K_046945 [Fragaria x ananassa]